MYIFRTEIVFINFEHYHEFIYLLYLNQEIWWTSFILCSSLHSYRERIEVIPSTFYPSCGVEPPHYCPCFLLFFASNTSDRVGPVGASAPGVGVPVGPPFLRLPASSSSSLWTSSFCRTRELGLIIIIKRWSISTKI